MKWGTLFDIASLLKQIEENEEEMNKQEFWNDNEKAQKVIQENKAFKDTVEEYNSLREGLEEIE